MASLLARVSQVAGLVSGGSAPRDEVLKEPAELWSDSLEATNLHFSPQRQRAKGKGGVECQVPSCAELVSNKVYYQRHKICLYHSNLPGVVLDGTLLRWCQQCGRFQDVHEFDGERKTCREVLERHNARRRKRTAERSGVRKAATAAAAAATHTPTESSCTSAKQPAGGAPHWADAAAPSISPISALLGPDPMSRASSLLEPPSGGSSGWDSAISQQVALAGMSRAGSVAQAPPGALPCSVRAAAGAPPAGAGTMDIDPEPGLEAGPEITSRMLDELMGDVELQDLLGFNPEHSMQLHKLPFLEPSLLSADLRELLGPLDSLPAGTATAAPAAPPAAPAPPPAAPQVFPSELQPATATVVLGQGRPAPTYAPSPFVLSAGSRGTATSAPAPVPPLVPQQVPAPAPHPAAYSGVPLPWLAQQPQPQPQFPAKPAVCPTPAQQQHSHEAMMRGMTWPMEAAVAPAGPSQAPPCFPLAATPSATAPPARQQETLVRLSMKLFNVEPEDLPQHVRQDVMGLITADPVFVDTFVRPGCTHLTLVAMLSEHEREQLFRGGAQAVAHRLLERSGWAGAGPSQGGAAWAADMLVQLGEEVAVVKEGQVAMVVRTEATAPHLAAARPAALFVPGSALGPLGTASRSGNGSEVGCELSEPSFSSDSCGSGMEVEVPGASGGLAPQHGLPRRGLGEGVVALWGHNISGSHDMVVCRQGGRVLNLEVLARGRLPGRYFANGPPAEWVLVKPLGVGLGLLQFEVQRGGLLSRAVSVAALPSRAAVAEAQLAQKTLTGSPGGQAFIQLLGMLAQYLHPAYASVAPHPLIVAVAHRLLGTCEAHGWHELAWLIGEVAGVPPPAAAPGPATEHSPAAAAATAGADACEMAPAPPAPTAVVAEAMASCGAATKATSCSVAGEAAPMRDEGEPSGSYLLEPFLPDEAMEEEEDEGEEGEGGGRPYGAGAGGGLGKSDYGKWVAQQLGSLTGSARGSLHACVAVLAVATSATLALRNMLGEVQ